MSNSPSQSLGGIPIGGYTGGRKNGGYSLRESLEHQGVTLEGSMRDHLSFVYETIKVVPTLDITRYRANPNHPNSTPMMG